MFLGFLFHLRDSRPKQDWPQGLSSYPQLHSIVTVRIIIITEKENIASETSNLKKKQDKYSIPVIWLFILQ